jgi:hypothetical protein
LWGGLQAAEGPPAQCPTNRLIKRATEACREKISGIRPKAFLDRIFCSTGARRSCYIWRVSQFYLSLRGTLLVTLILGLANASGASGKHEKTDAEIREEIITDSIINFRGVCACPYNSDWKGRRCDARSPYGRPEGLSLLCYPRDVSARMVAEWRKTHPEK